MDLQEINTLMQRAGSPAADRAAEALRAFATAVANVPMPPIHVIASFRLSVLATEYGWFRFAMPEYWEWRRLADSATAEQRGD